MTKEEIALRILEALLSGHSRIPNSITMPEYVRTAIIAADIFEKALKEGANSVIPAPHRATKKPTKKADRIKYL